MVSERNLQSVIFMWKSGPKRIFQLCHYSKLTFQEHKADHFYIPCFLCVGRPTYLYTLGWMFQITHKSLRQTASIRLDRASSSSVTSGFGCKGRSTGYESCVCQIVLGVIIKCCSNLDNACRAEFPIASWTFPTFRSFIRIQISAVFLYVYTPERNMNTIVVWCPNHLCGMLSVSEERTMGT